jgi:hypothetical protein
MKYLKMIGLTAVAAVVAMAFVGASSASATALCATNALPCPSPLPSGTAIKAELKEPNEAVLTSGFAVVKCKTSVIEGKTTSAGGAGVAVLGTISSVTWSNCTCNLGGTVVATAEGLPWSTEVNWTTGTMNGVMSTSNPKGSFTCGGEKCIYSTTTANTTVLGGSPAVVDAEVPLTRATGSGLLCSASATWAAKYTVTSPAALWISES